MMEKSKSESISFLGTPDLLLRNPVPIGSTYKRTASKGFTQPAVRSILEARCSGGRSENQCINSHFQPSCSPGYTCSVQTNIGGLMWDLPGHASPSSAPTPLRTWPGLIRQPLALLAWVQGHSLRKWDSVSNSSCFFLLGLSPSNRAPTFLLVSPHLSAKWVTESLCLNLCLGNLSVPPDFPGPALACASWPRSRELEACSYTSAFAAMSFTPMTHCGSDIVYSWMPFRTYLYSYNFFIRSKAKACWPRPKPDLLPVYYLISVLRSPWCLSPGEKN